MRSLLKWFKSAIHDVHIFKHYGTLNPERATLPRSALSVYVDSTDRRARKMLLYNAARGRFPRNQRFWRKSCELATPGIAIDVGANYGECIFGTEYARETTVLGVEANPNLFHWLERSHESHPQSGQIRLVNLLAARQTENSVPFYVALQWSGHSTASHSDAVNDPSRFQKLETPTSTIDDMIRGELDSGRSPIVIKIDVEGYERQVLAGMSETIACGRPLIVMIEFDLQFLTSAGEDISEFWDFMQKHFRVFWYQDEVSAVEVTGRNVGCLADFSKAGKIHSDILLTSRNTPEFLVASLCKLESSCRVAG
jgi:FkbM family methyltransferase